MQAAERAVILAAGLGTRLKWLSRERPKALMPVGGVPVIEHVIRRLASQGVRDIAVNLHHHGALLKAALGDGARLGVRLYFSHEDELLDSGGGVRRAMELLPGEGALVVHNADVLADVDVRALAGVCPQGGCALALIGNPPHHPRGDFALVGERVREQGEQRLTFAGVSVWDARALLESPEGESFSLVRPMRRLMRADRCAGLLHRGMWLDIGRPGDAFRAMRACYR